MHGCRIGKPVYLSLALRLNAGQRLPGLILTFLDFQIVTKIRPRITGLLIILVDLVCYAGAEAAEEDQLFDVLVDEFVGLGN